MAKEARRPDVSAACAAEPLHNLPALPKSSLLKS
jgi:hypothetical protein